MKYLNDLNEAQRRAVEHLEGPSIVIAGAGSGKTRVLTNRIAHLLHHHVDAFHILALTFTNKAAKEMKERIADIVGNTEAQNLWMGTFHSIFARILRYESEKIGYPTNFSIYDTDDSKGLIKTILKEMSLDNKIYKPGLVLHRISSAKNSMMSPDEYMQNTHIVNEDTQSAKPKLGEIYQTYNSRLFKASAMDFDDLLYKTNILLEDFPEALYKYQDKFRYILVDEFQDTNHSQYRILKKLAARFENICVVGDDAQSIYAFRGANIENILHFQRDYSDTKIFKLEQNYRSTQNIVNAANSVIIKNKKRLHKVVWTNNDAGEKIRVLRTLTDNEEGLSVANQIFETKNNKQLFNKDFAILYRTNAQSRAMEEALRKLNIPYRIYGGLSFYQRKEIKDLLAYFRLAINHNDEEALKRIINYPARGIGKTTIEKAIVTASEADKSLWAVLLNSNNFNLNLSPAIHGKIAEFTTKIKSFSSMLETHSAYDLGNTIAASSGILKDLHHDQSPEGISRYENIQELLNGMKEFSDHPAENGEKTKTLPEYMQDIALLTDADSEDTESNDKVLLMTIHAAKGLEFPYVFITGMEENLFPSQLSLNSRADLEEERRLFYVALTRAQKRVTLSYSASRYRWGNFMHCEPSRFIEEIDEKFIDFPKQNYQLRQKQVIAKRKNIFNARMPAKAKTQPKKQKIESTAPKRKLLRVRDAAYSPVSFVADDTKTLQVGMEVMHQRFGKGKVLNMEGGYPNQKATVFFPAAGQKQLLLKFAKLKIL